jgi:hypothetical protein
VREGVLVGLLDGGLFGLEVLDDVAIHIDLLVGVAEFLADAFDLLGVSGRGGGGVLERSAATALQLLAGDLLRQLLILLLKGVDQLAVDLRQPLDLAVLLHLLPPLLHRLPLVLVVTHAASHVNISMRKMPPLPNRKGNPQPTSKPLIELVSNRILIPTRYNSIERVR